MFVGRARVAPARLAGSQPPDMLLFFGCRHERMIDHADEFAGFEMEVDVSVS